MCQPHHIYGLDEAAVAYAVAAERVFGNDAAFLNSNDGVVPIFVNMLFQSLEISIKHAGIESGLFSMREARDRQNRSGHGIKELAGLAMDRLGGEPFGPLVTAMTFGNPNELSAEFIHEMICGPNLERTRESYALRRLGYGEVLEGDFAIIKPIPEWIDSVKQTALNLPRTIEILSQWRTSDSTSSHFAIWLSDRETA